MPFAHTRIPIHDLIWKEGSQFVNVNWMGLFSPTLWIPIQLNELAFTMLHIQRSIRMSIQNWIEWNVWVLIPLWIGHILANEPQLDKSQLQRCAQFRVESKLAHYTQFNFELTFKLIFECATLWMPIHWAEWGFIGLARTIPFNSHSRIDSLLPKSSHGWECKCARMAFELDTTLLSSFLRMTTTYPLSMKGQGQVSSARTHGW